MRQQSIGGAPLAFSHEEIMPLTVGPVFVQLATALLVRQGKQAVQLAKWAQREQDAAAGVGLETQRG